MNEEKFHVVINQSSQGPYTIPQIQALIREGKVQPGALVWSPAITNWKPWNEVPAIAIGVQLPVEKSPSQSANIPIAVGGPAGPGTPIAANAPSGTGAIAGAPKSYSNNSQPPSSVFWDFFYFKSMITPKLIMYGSWLIIFLSFLIGLGIFLVGIGRFQVEQIVLGLGLLVFGPLVTRLYAEILILFFRMNDTLTDIEKNQKKGTGL